MEINKLSWNNINQSSTGSSYLSGSEAAFSNTLSKKFKIPSNLDAIFEEASQRYQVPSYLLKAVAKAESDFNTRAVSHCGAQGVMQLMPGTAKSLGVKNAFDPYENIMGGSKYLSQLLRKYDGNVKFALAAYNAGSNNVDKYGGVPPFKETQNYVRKIMGYLNSGDELTVTPPLKSSAPIPASASSSSSTSSSVGVRTDNMYNAIFTSLLDFDDFSENDYLIFLELLKLSMRSSTVNSLNAEEDYERESALNTSRIQYLL